MTITSVILNMSVLVFLLASVLRIDAAEFSCPSGNVTCL